MYLILAMSSFSLVAVSVYFLVHKEGSYSTIFPVFVFSVSLFFVAANKFSHLLLKSVPKMNKATYIGKKQILCGDPSLFFWFQSAYCVILNIPTCFVGDSYESMLLAFGIVGALGILENGFLILALQLHLIEKLKEAAKANINNSIACHSSRIRQVKRLFFANAFLILTGVLSFGLVTVWTRIQIPPHFFSMLIGFPGLSAMHIFVVIFPPKTKQSAEKNHLPTTYGQALKKPSRSLQNKKPYIVPAGNSCENL